MSNSACHVLDETVNMALVSRVGDPHPSVMLKHDEIYKAFLRALELVELLRGKVDRDIFLIALSNAEILEVLLDNYELMAKKHSVSIPFNRSKDQNTSRYHVAWDEEATSQETPPK